MSPLVLSLLAAVPGPLTTNQGVVAVQVFDSAGLCGYRPRTHVELVKVSSGDAVTLDRRWTTVLGELNGDVVVSNQASDAARLELAVVDRVSGEPKYQCALDTPLESRHVTWYRAGADRLTAMIFKTRPPSGIERQPEPAPQVDLELRFTPGGCALRHLERLEGTTELRVSELPTGARGFRRVTRDGTELLEAHVAGGVRWSRPVRPAPVPCNLP
ncbi:MAG: hypothetical protein ACOZQL_33455 [Myxococcota bacterium]